MNFSTTNLKKNEDLLKEANYELRYEKGNFQSGYCLIQDRRIIVMNKYFTSEARFSKLLDILPQLELLNIDQYSENSKKIYFKFCEYYAQNQQLKLNLDEK